MLEGAGHYVQEETSEAIVNAIRSWSPPAPRLTGCREAHRVARMSVQWVRLGTDQVLVASSRRAWIQQPGRSAFGTLGSLVFTGPMPDSQPATEETTRHLLDGAIAAAERAAAPVDEPPLTTLRWAWNLASQWHCSHHSVSLLPDAIERYETIGRPDLADLMRQKLEEEQGHDQFPLDDLTALGYEARAVVREVSPAPTVTAGLDYARGCVQGDQPVEFLGYLYALERAVLNLDREWFKALDAALPPGVNAASGIRAHTELDLDHVDDAIAFCAALPAADRTAIAVGCYRTTEICCALSPDQIPSDPELEKWFSRFRVADAKSRDPAAARTKEEER